MGCYRIVLALGAEIEQWVAGKCAACEAIVAGAGTITHHHGVGTDHVPYLERQIGLLPLAALRRREGGAGPHRDHEPGNAAVMQCRHSRVDPRARYLRVMDACTGGTYRPLA